MPKFLPIFPLALVQFPGEKMNLHIFEPRYKQLLNECIAGKTTFVIPVVVKNEILDYGTEIEVVDLVKRYEGGEIDVAVKGIQVVKILELVSTIPDKLYGGAIVTAIENINDQHIPTIHELKQLSDQLFQLLEMEADLKKHAIELESFKMAHYVGFSLLEEFELLKHPRETTRQKMIVEHIKKILPAVIQIAKMKERAKLNGQFNIVNPPQHL